jgi:hypothetical protein
MKCFSSGLLRTALAVFWVSAAPLAQGHAAPADSAGAIRTPDLSFRFQPPADLPPPVLDEPPAIEVKRFGAAGSKYWTLGAGIAHNFIDAWDYNLRLAYSLFLIDDVEFSFELNGWYFQQDAKDAIGINPAIVFRWHLVHLEDRPWTVFADAGIGVLIASNQVPAGGTFLDFTPRVGAGYTHQISEDGKRLQLGLRWHHISNARISGDRRNPARDGLMLYAGVMIPF